MLTPEKVRKLRKLAERATPGPWEMSKWGDGTSGDVSANVIAPSSESTVCHDIMDFDAAFIAASHPAAVLVLLDEIERLWKILDDRCDAANTRIAGAGNYRTES